MKGFEAAFLWSRAKLLDDRARAAAERGETFHPSDTFMSLSDSVITAHAVFQRDPTRLVLRLRYLLSEPVTEDQLDRIAAIFYGGRRFTAMPSIVLSNRSVVERAYYCEDLPWKPSEQSSP
jgi:hypothetical protein